MKKPSSRQEQHRSDLPAKAAVETPQQAQRMMVDIPRYDGAEKSNEHLSTHPDGDRVKERFGKVAPTMNKDSRKDRDDQVPAEQPEQANGRKQGYLRLRVRVSDGKLSVVDATAFEGPLSQTTSFQGSHAYEVNLGTRLLHADTLPDVGVRRSFRNPRGSEVEQREQEFQLETYEFIVKVPVQQVIPQALKDISVRLLRVKIPVNTVNQPLAPLTRQFPHEMRVVSELHGLPELVLKELGDIDHDQHQQDDGRSNEH